MKDSAVNSNNIGIVNSQSRYTGKVYLVGAGPGDPGLITVKAKTLLEHADVVIYDALVSPAILGTIAPHAERLMQ